MTTFATTLTLGQQGWAFDFMFGKGGKNAGQAGSEIASTVDGLFMAIFWISMASFALLMGLTLYFVIKYRARPGVPSQRTASHNTPLELFWSVVPLMIMTWIFFKGFWGYMDMQTVRVGAEPISVTASTWAWKFTYANGAFSPETLQVGDSFKPVFVVPAGKPVKLTMSSDDAIHSFWVPAFRNKRDVFPNRYTTYNFIPLPLTEADEWHEAIPEVDRAYHNLRYQYRDHYVFCAEFCGNLHSDMTAIIRVVEPEVYAQIVNGWGTPDLPDAKAKLDYLMVKHACNSCHSTDGAVNSGPTWMNLFGYEFAYADGTTKTVDENHIRRAILNPGADIRAEFQGTVMSNYQGKISAKEMDMFIEVFNYLSDRGTKSMLDNPGADEGAGGEAGDTTDPSGQPENGTGNEAGTGEGGA